MRGVTPNYHHYYTFFLLAIFVLFRHVISINTLSSNEALTISSNKTIVSPNDVFELGFFKTTSSRDGNDRWYLGIWYKTTSKRTYLWIANRDNPLYNPNGTLKFSHTNLVLLTYFDIPVWSTNLTTTFKSPVVAELLDNGNFVLRDSKTKDSNRFLWQSFDFPVDTLLPEMKIGRNLKTGNERFLTSWKSPTDPSSGDHTFKLETKGLPEFYLWKEDFIKYRSGPWNGIQFNGIPAMQTLQKISENWSHIINSLIENREEVVYTFQDLNQNIHSRFRISSGGSLQVITWTSTVPQRNMFWSLMEDECDIYNRCGPYAYCDMNTRPTCNCISGFLPKNTTAWASGDMSYGCVRKTLLSCGEGDRFLKLRQMKLPETSGAIVDKRIGLKECEGRCVRDCNCTGFANTDVWNGGSGCVMWTGDGGELIDMRNNVVGGHDLYVKLAAASS